MDCPQCPKESNGAPALTLHPHQKTQVVESHGGQEFGYVLKGRIRLVCGSQSYLVKLKKPFIYRVPYYLENCTQQKPLCYGYQSTRFLGEIWKRRKIIQFRHIVKNFEDQVVLKGIDLDIYENEFVTLLGQWLWKNDPFAYFSRVSRTQRRRSHL